MKSSSGWGVRMRRPRPRAQNLGAEDLRGRSVIFDLPPRTTVPHRTQHARSTELEQRRRSALQQSHQPAPPRTRDTPANLPSSSPAVRSTRTSPKSHARAPTPCETRTVRVETSAPAATSPNQGRRPDAAAPRFRGDALAPEPEERPILPVPEMKTTPAKETPTPVDPTPRLLGTPTVHPVPRAPIPHAQQPSPAT